jgi:hypothetical protein
MILEDAMVKAHGKKTRPCSIFRGTWPDVDAEISGFVTTLHPARIVKRILPAGMDVLEFPEFRVIVCKLCQSAIRPSAVSTHLRRVHARYNSNPASEKQIRKFTNEILPKLTETPLLDPRNESVIVPAVEQTPLPHLRIYDGFGCSYCPLVSQAVRVMRNHYNITHALEKGVAADACLADKLNHKYIYRKEFPKAFAPIYSANHPSSIASIAYWLGEVTAEECNQFGLLSLLTRLTCECYYHAHSCKGYLRVLRQVFDHVDFLIECLSSNSGKIIAHFLVSHS